MNRRVFSQTLAAVLTALAWPWSASAARPVPVITGVAPGIDWTAWNQIARRVDAHGVSTWFINGMQVDGPHNIPWQALAWLKDPTPGTWTQFNMKIRRMPGSVCTDHTDYVNIDDAVVWD